MSGDGKGNERVPTKKLGAEVLKLLTVCKKEPNHAFRKNLDTLMLLVTYDRFKHSGIRERIIAAQEQLKDMDIDVNGYAYLVSEQTKKVIKEFGLPLNFKCAISTYLQTGEIDEYTIPCRNYGFRFRPRPTIKRDGYPEDPVLEVQLITYTRLTKHEIREAMKKLVKIQSVRFPSTNLFGNFKPKKDVGKELEAEIRLFKLQRPKTEQEYTSAYVAISQKQFDIGKMSKWQLEKIKRDNKKSIEKRKVKYTTSNVADELCIHASSVRHIRRRLNDERSERFG